MSPSLGEELLVYLSPTRVDIARIERGLRGHRRCAEKSVACSPIDGVPVWRPALDGLAKLLPELRVRARTIRITLADRFCRYLLVPWHEDLTDAGELEVLARRRFKEVFGEPATRWTLRLSATAYGASHLACAVDAELLRSINDLCGALKFSVASIRPLLVSAYNGWFESGGRTERWFSVRADDRFVLCRVENRAWRSVRVESVGVDFSQDLRIAVEREAMALGIDAGDTPVAQYDVQRNGGGLFTAARGVQGLTIDFGAQQRGWIRPAGVAMSAVALMVAAATLQEHRTLAEDVSAQETAVQELRRAARRDQRRIPETAEQSRQIQLEVRAANAVIERMVVPWDALFQAIESAADPTVAMLSIQPNVNARQVRISGEAGSYEAILDYARRIARTGMLDQVHLAEHAIKTQQPQHPIGFLLVARWRKSP